jgi:phosphoribosylanthranilate isomerase
MKYPQNIADVAALKPDFMGFIFYEKSSRFVKVEDIEDSISKLNNGISKVGVFVNHPAAEVIEICRALNLEYAQLHGDESAAYVSQIKSAGIGVFKVFRIDAQFDWDKTTAYADADLFLFDTPTAGYGGSGKKFDWRVLENYRDKNPFILSGGIGAEDIPEIKKLELTMLYGIDINSRMETAPAMKDTIRIQHFINELKK